MTTLLPSDENTALPGQEKLLALAPDVKKLFELNGIVPAASIVPAEVPVTLQELASTAAALQLTTLEPPEDTSVGLAVIKTGDVLISTAPSWPSAPGPPQTEP